MSPAPRLIGSEIYRHSSFGERHPLAIPRVSTALDLIRALGALDDGAWFDSPQATLDELARFHDRDYLDVLVAAERDRSSVTEAQKQRHRIGIDGNPIHPRIFSRPATSCGGTLLATRLLEAGGTVYNMGGGTHHGRRDRAAGFCYLNDPVLGMLALLDRGYTRVMYVDLDAHHGDGVQDALGHDPRCLIVSVHEEKRWPFTGIEGDRGGGQARNLPVPAGFNDSELDHVVEAAFLPLARRFRPEVLILQCGADGLAEDPLSRLALSNGALWRAVSRLKALAPRVLVLGGGGYNPWSVARCWAGLWLPRRCCAVSPGNTARVATRRNAGSRHWPIRRGRVRCAMPYAGWPKRRLPESGRRIIQAAMKSLRFFAVIAALLLPPAEAEQLATFTKGEVVVTTASGPHKFAVELAISEAQREQGLMFRQSMPADAGMLFLYQEDQPIAMWMKNTYIPLDMVFIAADGTVVNVGERATPQSTAIIASDGPVRAALELNGGIAGKLGIKPGDKVTGEGLGG
jgi:acetoin utilization protein AcuC